MENITVKKVVINYNKELLDSIDNKCQKKHNILDTIVTIAAIPIILYLGYYIRYIRDIINKNATTEMFTYIIVLIIGVLLIIFDILIDDLLDVPKRNNKLYRINKILYHASLNKINDASFRKIDGKWYCNSADMQDTISFFCNYCEYPIYVALEDILNYELNDFTDKIEIPDQWDSLSISVNEKTQKIDVLFT